MSVAVVLWIAEMIRCVSRVCCCVWVVGAVVVGVFVIVGGGVAFLGLCDAYRLRVVCVVCCRCVGLF